MQRHPCPVHKQTLGVAAGTVAGTPKSMPPCIINRRISIPLMFVISCPMLFFLSRNHTASVPDHPLFDRRVPPPSRPARRIWSTVASRPSEQKQIRISFLTKPPPRPNAADDRAGLPLGIALPHDSPRESRDAWTRLGAGRNVPTEQPPWPGPRQPGEIAKPST
ncbi:hypothetical protein GWI33_005693 [Rhynchophorus ferrugineus]|uniref:Uncharacterized protein n=1 Tax=Rhynchophorus ferrugineus TaxID=354439 RepID=A0A834ILB5_RHYFE|nr:hypothetical protein GWI33_005693 [Rhynchophorus ferrugineus]